MERKRRDRDLMKLMMSNYKVTVPDEKNSSDFYVQFHGPKDSPYEGGVWKIHVYLAEGYPYKSPSIGFNNKIYHPNIDEASGTVCLDVINQTWSPMYDLMNIFDVFLPQLLLYPNPTDPLNREAGSLMLKDTKKFNAKIKEYVEKYAKKIEEEDLPVDENKELNSEVSELSVLSVIDENEKSELIEVEENEDNK